MRRDAVFLPSVSIGFFRCWSQFAVAMSASHHQRRRMSDFMQYNTCGVSYKASVRREVVWVLRTCRSILKENNLGAK